MTEEGESSDIEKMQSPGMASPVKRELQRITQSESDDATAIFLRGDVYNEIKSRSRSS